MSPHSIILSEITNEVHKEGKNQFEILIEIQYNKKRGGIYVEILF